MSQSIRSTAATAIALSLTACAPAPETGPRAWAKMDAEAAIRRGDYSVILYCVVHPEGGCIWAPTGLHCSLPHRFASRRLSYEAMGEAGQPYAETYNRTVAASRKFPVGSGCRMAPP
jgi:hypothetical protein